MTMELILLKITPALHQQIVRSEGMLLDDLLFGEGEVDEMIDLDIDIYDELDYRDVAEYIPERPALQELFEDGTPIVAGYEWASGPPSYFEPAAVQRLTSELEADDTLPLDELVDFLRRATREGKGVVLGIN